MEIPESYKCSDCGIHGVKLWRIYQTFLENQRLFCAVCALRDQKKDWTIDEDGRHTDDYGGSDQIGWLVPAVPVDDTFWGYTSVPAAGVEWWKRLPTYEYKPTSHSQKSGK
jgi:hypothetical protein